MNEIKVEVKFKTQELIVEKDKDVITGDYATTKLVFSFDDDYSSYRLVFSMRNQDGEVVLVKEIGSDNEIVLVAYDDDGNECSLFGKAGRYVFEVIRYGDDSRLTSASGSIFAEREAVKIGDKVFTPYLPMIDQLYAEIQNVNKVVGDIATTQSNWNQNDPTQPDYIQNRTHYSTAIHDDIIWDGDVTNRPFITESDVVSVVKVSDDVLTVEELVGCTIEMVMTSDGVVNNVVQSFIIDESQINVETDNGVICTVTGIPKIYIVYDIDKFQAYLENAGISTSGIITNGIYVFYQTLPSATFYVNLLFLGTVKKLDKKYLPDDLVNRPELDDYYTKPEIDTLVGDIESLLGGI